MFKLALKNINRNKKRTILSGLSIFVATLMISLLLSFEHGAINSIIDNTIKTCFRKYKYKNKKL